MCFSSWPCLPCCLVCYHSNLHYLPWQPITYTCPSSSLVNLCLYIPLWFSCVLSSDCSPGSCSISSLYTLQCSYCQSLPVLWCCFCFRPINSTLQMYHSLVVSYFYVTAWNMQTQTSSVIKNNVLVLLD